MVLEKQIFELILLSHEVKRLLLLLGQVVRQVELEEPAHVED